MNKPEILAPAGSFDSLTPYTSADGSSTRAATPQISATRSWRRRSNTAMRAGSRFISRSTPLCVTMRLKRR